jgi:hypothetical protein
MPESTNPRRIMPNITSVESISYHSSQWCSLIVILSIASILSDRGDPAVHQKLHSRNNATGIRSRNECRSGNKGLAQRLTEESSRGHLSIEVFENRVRVRGTYTQLIPRIQTSRHSVALTDGPRTTGSRGAGAWKTASSSRLSREWTSSCGSASIVTTIVCQNCRQRFANDSAISTLLSAPVMLQCIAFRVATNPHRPEILRRS